MSSSDHFLGIDVGTGSVRAAIINKHGVLICSATEPITTHHPYSSMYEQSSDEIWSSIGRCVRKAKGDIPAENIKGIGFDATCSLVVLDKQGNPSSVNEQSAFTDSQWNIILWADHRAIQQANKINDTHHPVLDYVGGNISPEMDIPKILWMHEHLSTHQWDTIGHFMNLPDYLTYKATGNTSRSTCSLTCKCSYLPKNVGNGWEPSFFEQIGLKCLVETEFHTLAGNGCVLDAGMPVGNGLLPDAADLLGLRAGTPVGSALIDAYAGAVATLGASSKEKSNRLLAIICGTSSCHIAVSPEPIFVPGVWGPYRSVMISNQWHAEAGQSSTGQLIDFILETHPAYKQLIKKLGDSDIYSYLEQHLILLQKKHGFNYLCELSKDVHIYPDFHGNRSPLADPSLRGMMVGLSLDRSVDDMAIHYLATLQAIACQTRHIIDTLNKAGYTIDTLCMSGGLCKNKLFIRLLVDITQCKIVLPESIESAVVIGAAYLGAKASGLISDDLWDIMVQLGKPGSIVYPDKDKELIRMNNNRYRVFHAMLSDQIKYRRMMNE